ncbi:MAG: class I SAM-dependent methyltransferase [Labilithrix sp.]|nr:class I SAM-dependent methyltransferase [Labilithrix sp.]
MSRRDRELEAGARAHFEDPDYYAVTYAKRKDDVAYYTQVASKHDAMLEYGIGSGRIAIPVARSGVSVWGVDRSRPMLRDLRARLAREPAALRARVTARAGDMRRVRLKRRFTLAICPFNTVLHLYTRQDLEAWLARVREHLSPRGELVLDASMPILEDLADEPGTAYTMRPFVHPSAGLVNYREVFDYDRVRQILFVSMCFEPTSKERQSFMVPLAHRQFFPRELEALLHYNGFETTAVYGDFQRGPLVQSSDVMVWHARRRRG